MVRKLHDYFVSIWNSSSHSLSLACVADLPLADQVFQELSFRKIFVSSAQEQYMKPSRKTTICCRINERGNCREWLMIRLLPKTMHRFLRNFFFFNYYKKKKQKERNEQIKKKTNGPTKVFSRLLQRVLWKRLIIITHEYVLFPRNSLIKMVVWDGLDNLEYIPS